MANETAFVVSLFWPGVGEVDVEARDRFVCDVVCDQDGGIVSCYSDVFELPSACAVDGVFIVFFCPFDSEEVDIAKCAGLVYEESALSGAYFQVDRGGTSENIVEIQFPFDIFGI